MQLHIRLGEVLTPELILAYSEHIRDFLVLEGVRPDPNDLAATELTERQIKELLEELAEEN
ncbi:MAG: hypothetical protein SH847_27060 [Roseiflexaceae bacterium]|nr:hypothetical protein [Roseiflexaceae bacterium]